MLTSDYLFSAFFWLFVIRRYICASDEIIQSNQKNLQQSISKKYALGSGLYFALRRSSLMVEMCGSFIGVALNRTRFQSYNFPYHYWSAIGVNVTHLSGQNGRHFADDVFKCICMNEKFCVSNRILLKFIPKCPIDNEWEFDPGNGLAPNRRQAITWTNAGPVYWRIYVSLGGDELTFWVKVIQNVGISSQCR